MFGLKARSSGFPESHAASFSLIAYASNFVKCHYPDVFCAALLNSQPMGFYAPAQIVGDARNHGVANSCHRKPGSPRYYAGAAGEQMDGTAGQALSVCDDARFVQEVEAS